MNKNDNTQEECLNVQAQQTAQAQTPQTPQSHVEKVQQGLENQDEVEEIESEVIEKVEAKVKGIEIESEISEEGLYFKCPHDGCTYMIYVEKKNINCGIFRNASYKKTNLPIKPHTSQHECEKLLKSDKIWGCAHPFKIKRVKRNKVENNVQHFKVSMCSYK